jgi:hypothetical protein
MFRAGSGCAIVICMVVSKEAASVKRKCSSGGVLSECRGMSISCRVDVARNEKSGRRIRISLFLVGR